MTASMESLSQPLSPQRDNRPYWRDLLETTVSYLKWGYGALLLFVVGCAIYRDFDSFGSGRGFAARDLFSPQVIASVLGPLAAVGVGFYLGRATRKA